LFIITFENPNDICQDNIGEKDFFASIDLVKKTYARAHLLDKGVRFASPERIEPPCALYLDCGGCQLLHQSYEGQLAMKQQCQ
jgi:tRNA/tmRNA/rRNA uracil-C5-methylase (TrmA/RlmC/RlmD family)